MIARALLVAALVTLSPGPQETWRAAALASFDEVWQTIDDTFYDPGFGGLDWDGVRAELRPKVQSAASASDVRAIITDMLTRLHRSHFVVLNESAVDAGAPAGDASLAVDLRVIDTPGPDLPRGSYVVVTRVEAGSPAAHAGIQPGDLLSRIDTTNLLPTGSRSGGSTDPRVAAYETWRRATRALQGLEGSRVDIHGSRHGRAFDVQVARTRESSDVVTVGNLPPLPVRTETRQLVSPGQHRIGLIAFNVWMTPIDAPVEAAVDRFRNADGLVIDLRGNPGGLAAMISGIAGHLLPDSSTLLGRMQTRQATLEFRPNPRLSTADGRRVTPYAGPVALLVDELTASASECFAGALQSLGRARVFGRQTMGEALPALTKRLPNGDVLMYAIGDFVTSRGNSLEGPGVIPDERIPLVPEALATGHDADLEAALRWFDTRKQAENLPLALGRRLLLSSDDRKSELSLLR